MALGGVFRASILFVAFFAAWSSGAREVEHVGFSETLDYHGHQLVLNGAGLRVVRKFGMDFRVYVAGLYVTKKSDDAAAVLASPEPKVLRMVFLRSVDKGALQKGFREELIRNCKNECEKMTPKFNAYLELLISPKEKDEITLTFETDRLMVEARGHEPKTGTVVGADISKNLLAVFIGDLPATEQLKAALLGK